MSGEDGQNSNPVKSDNNACDGRYAMNSPALRGINCERGHQQIVYPPFLMRVRGSRASQLTYFGGFPSTRGRRRSTREPGFESQTNLLSYIFPSRLL